MGRNERFLLALRLLDLKEPDAEWVADPVRDRDMHTLQTAAYRKLDDRHIVRAERICAAASEGLVLFTELPRRGLLIISVAADREDHSQPTFSC